ncbi:opsin 8, group member c [Gadus morhua]|uniref:G-protein coupled receptors family 1 profile domain-containing protein n=1 Tax=Gadus morhua TaxID=8049 RepID=A0A8C5FX53_GADMO|nr:opsin-5-like [Gadus morhua]
MLPKLGVTGLIMFHQWMHYLSMLCLYNMSLNSTLHEDSDNGPISIYTSKLDPGADICLGLAILFVVTLSLLGNGVVLLVSYRRRKRTVGSELLCVNLAVVDFLCCVCFYPLSIMSSFSHGWLGQGLTCVYYGLGCFIFGLCGMFTVAAISVVHYMKTCHRLVYAVWLEGANTKVVCVATWALPTLWSCLPLLGWGEYVPEPYGLSCTVAWRGYHTSYKDATYVVCSFAGFTLLPVLAIVGSQGLILRKLYRFSAALTSSGLRSNLRHAERRLTMMFLCISLGFILAWGPYTVVSFLFIFHQDHRYMAPWGFVFPALFAKSSHVYNPFIYFYFNAGFRRELRGLVRSLCPGLESQRVGVRSHSLPPHGAQAPSYAEPHPIHIQLQEQRGRRSDNSGSSREKPPKLSGAGGAGLRQDRSVHPCWGSKPRVSPASLEHKQVKEFLSDAPSENRGGGRVWHNARRARERWRLFAMETYTLSHGHQEELRSPPPMPIAPPLGSGPPFGAADPENFHRL